MNKVRLMQEAARCLLCENAPCTAACHAGDPARAVRAIGISKRVPKRKKA